MKTCGSMGPRRGYCQRSRTSAPTSARRASTAGWSVHHELAALRAWPSDGTALTDAEPGRRLAQVVVAGMLVAG